MPHHETVYFLFSLKWKRLFMQSTLKVQRIKQQGVKFQCKLNVQTQSEFLLHDLGVGRSEVDAQSRIKLWEHEGREIHPI